MITGLTSSKLSQVATYNLNNPYQVGVNGVTDVIEDGNQLTVKYDINGIDYETIFTLREKDLSGNFKKINVSLIDDSEGNFVRGPKAIQQSVAFTNFRRGNPLKNKRKGGDGVTIFKSYLSGFDFEDYPAIKEENKLGQVFPPEIKDEIFIERTSSNIYERHSRLEDINNIDQLERYKNGFFNVVKR
jgi:hypothetical protein